MYSKKNNTNNLDKIEKYSNEQDKIIEAIKEDKSNIKKKGKNNVYEYDPSYHPNSSFEVLIINYYNCHEHIMIKRHMKFEFIDKFYGIIFALLPYFPGAQL